MQDVKRITACLPAGKGPRKNLVLSGKIKMAASPVIFLKGVKGGLKKVVWPTREEVIRLTFVVIAVSLIVGLFLGGADFILTKLTQVFLNR